MGLVAGRQGLDLLGGRGPTVPPLRTAVVTRPVVSGRVALQVPPGCCREARRGRGCCFGGQALALPAIEGAQVWGPWILGGRFRCRRGAGGGVGAVLAGLRPDGDVRGRLDVVGRPLASSGPDRRGRRSYPQNVVRPLMSAVLADPVGDFREAQRASEPPHPPLSEHPVRSTRRHPELSEPGPIFRTCIRMRRASGGVAGPSSATRGHGHRPSLRSFARACRANFSPVSCSDPSARPRCWILQ